MLDDADQAIAFYEKAFGATELFRITKPDGKVLHAEILIEDSLLMAGDAAEPLANPLELNGTTVGAY